MRRGALFRERTSCARSRSCEECFSTTKQSHRPWSLRPEKAPLDTLNRDFIGWRKIKVLRVIY